MVSTDPYITPGDTLRELPTTFCGIRMTQWWADLFLWERVLNEHPEIEQIVELGTGAGGFSLYLSMQAEQRGMKFATFDVTDYRTTIVPGFILCDIFEDPECVWNLLGRPTIMHCDNGDKARELREFATELMPGSLCIVHDWGIEVSAEDVPESLQPIHRDLWQGLSTVFARVE